MRSVHWIGFPPDGMTPRACHAARPRSTARSQASRRRAPLPGLGLPVTIAGAGQLLTLAVAACAAALLVASAGGAGMVWSRPKWLPLNSAGSDRLVGLCCHARATSRTAGSWLVPYTRQSPNWTCTATPTEPVMAGRLRDCRQVKRASAPPNWDAIGLLQRTR